MVRSQTHWNDWATVVATTRRVSKDHCKHTLWFAKSDCASVVDAISAPRRQCLHWVSRFVPSACGNNSTYAFEQPAEWVAQAWKTSRVATIISCEWKSFLWDCMLSASTCRPPETRSERKRALGNGRSDLSSWQDERSLAWPQQLRGGNRL